MKFEKSVGIWIVIFSIFVPCKIKGVGIVHNSHGEENRLPQPFKLNAGIERVQKFGKPLNMFCNIPDYISLGIKHCSWLSPEQKEYDVNGDKVFEKDGNIAQGITVHSGGSKTCNITINELNENLLGNWICKIEFQNLTSNNQSANSIDTDSEKYPPNLFLSTTLTAKKSHRVKDVRLPNHMRPQHYRLFLIPFLKEDNFTIKGRTEIDILLIKNSSIVADSIRLHIKDMTISPKSVNCFDENRSSIPIIGHGYDPDREFFIIYLQRAIERNFTITIEFTANLNSDMAGFYRSTYKDVNTGEDKYIATSQMEPTDARRALPCFDEPNMKSTFQINIGRTKSMTSMSNMPKKVEGKPMEEDDEYVWDEYEPTLKMSTYLLAFVVSDFKYREGNRTENNVTFRIWSRESVLEQTKYATSIGPQILQYYENYFGINFPLPKQDMIAIPDFSAGAMENWGLITYRETALLYEPGISSLMNKQYVALVVAHELAHQWFGDLVTMDWWTDLWLNEGFASYMEYDCISHFDPDTGVLDRFVIEALQSVMENDALQTSHPISVTVHHPQEIAEIFDGISYSKGASVIRMMANFLGMETFKKGVTNYLRKNEFSNAEQDDLWNSLTAAAHEDHALDTNVTVKEIMDTWTIQMGFPVVHVQRGYDSKNEIVMQQERFLLYEDKESSFNESNKGIKYKWWIPISYTAPGGDFSETKAKMWMKPDDEEVVQSINIPNHQALILNVQETGYYRVNYDQQNWKLIKDALDSNHTSIHRVNRAQILNDAFRLAEIGLLNYSTALSLTNYLQKETDFVPWQAALTSLTYLDTMLGRTGAYGDFKKYLKGELKFTYDRLGFEPKQEDTFLDILLRKQVIHQMCQLDYEPCIEEALHQFETWMSSANPEEDNKIDPALRYIVYCTAISKGDEREWDFLWEQYEKTNNANEKSTIIQSLACSKHIWILQRYLNRVMDPSGGIRKQDGGRVIAMIGKNEIGRDLTWDWIRSKWQQISSYFDTGISSSLGQAISAVTSDFYTDLQLQELENFYNMNLPYLKNAARKTKNAIQWVRVNNSWMKRNFETIVNWLAAQ